MGALALKEAWGSQVSHKEAVIGLAWWKGSEERQNDETALWLQPKGIGGIY